MLMKRICFLPFDRPIDVDHFAAPTKHLRGLRRWQTQNPVIDQTHCFSLQHSQSHHHNVRNTAVDFLKPKAYKLQKE